MRTVILICSLIVAAVPVMANDPVGAPLSADDQAQISKAKDAFREDFLLYAHAALALWMPPSLIAPGPGKAGEDTEARRKEDFEQLRAELAVMTVVEATYEPDFEVEGTAPNGLPFAIMRLDTTVSFGETSFVRMRIPFITFPEDGNWYIWSIETDASQRFLIQNRPEFADIDFPDPQ